MRWTTANISNADYLQNDEIFVGTHTGSFKKLDPANKENPFQQTNLYDLNRLNKESRITCLEFGDKEQSEILIGRVGKVAQLYSLKTEEAVVNDVKFTSSPIVGLARYEQSLFCGSASGQIEKVSLEADDVEPIVVSTAGDDMSHMRQCPMERKLVATGGKGRQNNLKIFDMEIGKAVFKSKNLPNDYLQLEVPIWDSDVGFIDSFTPVTCSRYGYVRVYDTRKQRRPVQTFAADNKFSFSALAIGGGHFIYAGTTMGVLKAFDTRCMKNFVHSYKGFTGSISDLYLDTTGTLLASASLDRYVRVHHANSCMLLYQCYVKSKATRVLMRRASSKITKKDNEAVHGGVKLQEEVQQTCTKQTISDDEYDQLFDTMQTVCENEESKKKKRKLDTKKIKKFLI